MGTASEPDLNRAADERSSQTGPDPVRLPVREPLSPQGLPPVGSPEWIQTHTDRWNARLD